MSAMAASASSWYSATLAALVTSQTSSRWCGTPRRSAGVSLAVPMSIPRYSCIESALTTSPPTARASSTARSDFPAAVAPTTAISVIAGPLGAAGRHAPQHRRGRGFAGRGGRGRRGRRALAGLPGVARPGPAHAERLVVGPQVMRRGAGDAGDGDVAGAGLLRTGGEVDQAVVAGPAGQPAGGGVLAPLPLGDQHLDHGAVLLLVLIPGDLLLEGHEPL